MKLIKPTIELKQEYLEMLEEWKQNTAYAILYKTYCYKLPSTMELGKFFVDSSLHLPPNTRYFGFGFCIAEYSLVALQHFMHRVWYQWIYQSLPGFYCNDEKRKVYSD